LRATNRQIPHDRAKSSPFKTKLTQNLERRALAEHVSRRLMGCPMKNEIATHGLHHECYVLRIDGRVKSTHRRLVDALRAGLKLRDEFPHHHVKVSVKQIGNSIEKILHGIVLH
jgi:hypothetical protein